MIRWLLALFVCDHADALKERREDGLYFVCPNCGHEAPALRVTADDQRTRDKLARRMKRSKPVAKPSDVSKVARFRKVGR